MKKYSLFSNYKYQMGILYRGYKDVVFARTAEIIMCVINPILGSFATAFVVQLVVDNTPIPRLILTVLGAFALYGLMTAFQSYLRERCAVSYIDVRLENQGKSVMNKYSSMRLDRLEAPETRILGEKANDACNYNHMGTEGFYHNLATFMIRVLGLITYIGIIGSLNPGILLLLFGTSLLSALVSLLYNKVEQKSRDELAPREMTIGYINRLTDNPALGKDIRVYGLSSWIIGKFDKAIRDVRKIKLKVDSVRFGRDTVDNVFSLVRSLICYIYLITLMEQGMPISRFVLFIGLIGGFSQWLELLSWSFMNLLRDSDMVKEVRNFVDLEDETVGADRAPFTHEGSLRVEFKDVCFSYPGSEKPVIKNLSFRVEPGEKLAIVGVNGAGKSTIVKLLSGLYMPSSGSILINGMDTRKMDLKDFYKREAAVFQDVFTVSYSIGENIALSEDYDEALVEEVLKKAGLWDKVQTLPKGINTSLGHDMDPDGINLSGGETQKLLLARALYKNPGLILLDEPTAALDALAESEVYKNYDSTLSGVTALFISHRLASTRFCDRILFLEDGRVAEEGSHEKLLSLGGKYKEMFEVQSKYYAKEGGAA